VCVCSWQQIERYQARISQPLLDRLDVHIEVPQPRFETLVGGAPGEASAAVRARVDAARERQRHRFAKLEGVFGNAQIPAQLTRSLCAADGPAEALLAVAMERWKLSARVYHRVLRISRTLADLAGRERVGAEDVAEALQYRGLERPIEVGQKGNTHEQAG